MSTLTDFLNEQAQRLGQPEVQKDLAEWEQSVAGLMTKVANWLHEADPKGVLKIKRTTHELREEKFGLYELPGLTIDMGGRRVEIIPRGGAVGGVVRLRDGRTPRIRGLVELSSDLEKVRLFRLLDESGEHWIIKPEVKGPEMSLEKSSFEETMMQLLSYYSGSKDDHSDLASGACQRPGGCTGVITDPARPVRFFVAGVITMLNSLDDAWRWYRDTRTLLKLQRRLALYWDNLPWDGPVAKDRYFQQHTGTDLQTKGDFSLSHLDDLAIVVLFSVFESLVRQYVLREVVQEEKTIQHRAIRLAVTEAKDRIEFGSFFHVLAPFKDQHNVDPETAYNRLHTFLQLLEDNADNTPAS